MPEQPAASDVKAIPGELTVGEAAGRQRLRDNLSGCIGCGCLSLDLCERFQAKPRFVRYEDFDLGDPGADEKALGAQSQGAEGQGSRTETRRGMRHVRYSEAGDRVGRRVAASPR
jgi:hypothetical protein